MKYSSSNKPLVCMMTQSTCYNGTTKMNVKGILWHSTGANNPTLKRYVQPSDNDPNKDALIKIIGKNSNGNDWNHVRKQAGLNFWIGKLADGSVAAVQTMPWDYRPWGCGSGSKGSCNDGWIQFEICEDGLTDKTYFNAVYKEACEMTAYLCDMYNIDPNGTVTHNGVKVPTILCHADSYKLGLGSNHGDVYHWFSKHGKSMETARADVAALMGVKSTPTTGSEMYRIRKTWADAASQKGAYTNFDSAKKACDVAGVGYEVYNSKGEVVYTPSSKSDTAITTKKPDVIYQVYAGGKWWGEITNYNESNSNGYAGVFGKEISGIRVKLSNGKTVTVMSHISGNARNDWLAPVTKWDNTSNGYSGWKGKPTDCIAMKADSHTLKYRVHVKGGNWLGWVSKCNINDYNSGLAGAYGKPIDAVQIMVV